MMLNKYLQLQVHWDLNGGLLSIEEDGKASKVASVLS